MEAVAVIVSLVMLGLAFCIYFFPAIVASNRGRAVAPIWIVNFFFGWTFIGWALALVWAATERSPREEAAHAERQRSLKYSDA